MLFLKKNLKLYRIIKEGIMPENLSREEFLNQGWQWGINPRGEFEAFNERELDERPCDNRWAYLMQLQVSRCGPHFWEIMEREQGPAFFEV